MLVEQQRNLLIDRIAKMNRIEFNNLALEVFQYQAVHNELYAKYLALLSIKAYDVKNITQIPFLPINLFQNHKIQTGEWDSVAEFYDKSRKMKDGGHFLRNAHWYRYNTRRCFEYFYDELKSYCILALLPSYLDRSGSSLVFMVDDFIQQSDYLESGFFIKDTNRLTKVIQKLKKENIKILLVGDGNDLLEFALKFPNNYEDVTIMQTKDVHNLYPMSLYKQLQLAFNTKAIHEEFGLNECLSQSYSKSNGIFHVPPPMKVLCRDPNDPFQLQKSLQNGRLNIIDLANIDTCSFIATEIDGMVIDKNRFELTNGFV